MVKRKSFSLFFWHTTYQTLLVLLLNKTTVELKKKHEYLFLKGYIFRCEDKKVRGQSVYPKIKDDYCVTVFVSGL